LGGESDGEEMRTMDEVAGQVMCKRSNVISATQHLAKVELQRFISHLYSMKVAIQRIKLHY